MGETQERQRASETGGKAWKRSSNSFRGDQAENRGGGESSLGKIEREQKVRITLDKRTAPAGHAGAVYFSR
jgi:hypothetical protein